ncbi:MAG: LamG-like jellyroll fold domain-containing protein [Pirellulales bacterium]
MKINGGTTSVDVAATNADFNRTYSAFSLSMWVNPLSGENSVTRYYAGKMAGGGNRGWQLARGTNETMSFLYFDGPSGTSQSINSGSTVPASVYTHLAVTYAGDDFLRMYLNGVLVAELTESVDNILSQLNGANNALFQVGNRGDNISGGSSGSTGARIDDFGLWDEALTTAQIQKIHFWGNQGLNLQQALAVPEGSTLILALAAMSLGGIVCLTRRRRQA